MLVLYHLISVRNFHRCRRRVAQIHDHPDYSYGSRLKLNISGLAFLSSNVTQKLILVSLKKKFHEKSITNLLSIITFANEIFSI